jgi:spore maturation protein SpmA
MIKKFFSAETEFLVWMSLLLVAMGIATIPGVADNIKLVFKNSDQVIIRISAGLLAVVCSWKLRSFKIIKQKG